MEHGPVVYVIRCLPTGEVYVGSTVSLRGRWATHRGALRSGAHYNRLLQSAWDLFGEPAFELSVAEVVDPPAGLRAAEAEWMDRLSARVEGLGFNLRGAVHAEPGAGSKNNVITFRLDDSSFEALDTLVEASVRATRSDAAAWLIAAGIDSHKALFDRLASTIQSIRQLRLEAQAIANEVASGQAAGAEPDTPADTGEPPQETQGDAAHEDEKGNDADDSAAQS